MAVSVTVLLHTGNCPVDIKGYHLEIYFTYIAFVLLLDTFITVINLAVVKNSYK